MPTNTKFMGREYRRFSDIEMGDNVDLIVSGAIITKTAVLLSAGEGVDLNGEVKGVIMDADGNTSISAPTDNQIDFEVNGADDFRMTANTFTALSGSTIATNTIAETTAASGVTIDSLLVKDGGLVATGATAIKSDIISEVTSATGVTIDGLLVKDGMVGALVVASGDGAITIQNSVVHVTKGTAAALTLAAPTAGTHDGIEITVVSETAAAHVITGSVDGFNAKGSSGTATFGAAKGNCVTFRARNGHWWTTSSISVTIA